MAKFEREIIQSKDLIDEKKILIGLITNKNLLLSIRSKIKNDFFDADYMKRVATWAIDFYDKTKEPVSANIKDIYEKETLDLKDTDKELIDELHSSLSETFEGQGNERYLEETFKNLYKKKELKRNIDEALFYYRSDDVDSAYKALRKNNEVEKDTTRCFDPFAKEEILKFFANDEDDRMVIFSNPTLNKFFRYFKPGWFISIQATEKSGKSFFLEELSFCAVEAGYNVLILSVELNEDLMKERIYCRLSGRSKDEEEDVLTPVMDCKHNQHNQCTSKYRSCKTGCYDASGKKMSIDDVYNYSPCTYCRENKSKDYKFEPGIWHEKTNIQKMEPNDVIKQGAIYKKIYKGRMKVCCPDSFSTDIDEIENIIDYLEEVENFYPDFLILDYLDIVNSKSKEVGREKINQIWIRTKQLTDRKKLCTITVEQTSKAGALQVSQDATHVSEEKRKNGHVNAKYSINMTKEESEDSVVRLGEIFHRHFRKQKKQLLCLRQLETASPIIDCELVDVQDTEVKRHTYK